MAFWLIKTEPSSWSWQDQVKAGRTQWDGVRNYQASANLKAMRLGDEAFFYHSVQEKCIVGIVRVVKEYYPDPTDESGRFGMVDVESVCAFLHPVTLAEIKTRPELVNLPLVRQSRLSVMPISGEDWFFLRRMGNLDP